VTTDARELRTQQIGHELFRAVRRAAQNDGLLAWARDRALSLIMRDEAVKTSLFRLVDALPALQTPRQINRHLKEYAAQVHEHLPPFMAETAHRIPENGPIAAGIAGVARSVVNQVARTFIAAGDVDHAAAAVLKLRREKLAFTIDLLGEAVVCESEADEYAARYVRLIDGLSDGVAAAPAIAQIDEWPLGNLPRVNVSVKLSSLFSQFDPIDPDAAVEAVSRRLRPILQLARRRGAFVCFDMEQFAFKNLTLQIFKEILLEPGFRDWPDVGIAIQAYLKISGEDLKDLEQWVQQRGSPIWVRLVKGAYWDYECVVAAQNGWPTPVFTEKPQTDAHFERLSEFLIARHALLRPAIASHNVRDIARALALAEYFKLPPRLIEFQMLHGMADPIKRALVDFGQRVRIYAPVGRLLPGMAYLVRRLLENTSNQSFLRAALLEHLPEEELLMNPMSAIAAKPTKLSRDEFRNEPPSDFSLDTVRQSMSAAFRDFSPKNHPLVIGGKRISTPECIDSINPSHKRHTAGRVGKATVENAHQAIAAAKTAFATWRNQSADDRADLLLKVADNLRRRRFELAALEIAECGKPWREADADIAEAIDFCVYYSHQARRLGKPRHVDLPGETNEQFYEPRGIAVVIAPWNFPLAIPCGMTAAAVVSGNTVIMKPAEQSSVVAAMLMDAFEVAGAPAGVVNYLPGIGEEIGPALVEHPDVALIAFTGSRQVGLAISESASRTPRGQMHVKRVIAEMGGKNAIIVDADADSDEAIHGVVASAFGYAGQKCSACSRVIVLDEIYDAFLGRLIEAVKSLKIAPAEDPGCFVGPVIDAEAHARILAKIERGKSEAKLAFAADAGALADEGYYIGPHVFTDVPADSSLAQEEIFGPVLAALRARDLDHALEIANGVAYALTGGIYSRNPATIQRAQREFRVGDLYINRKITGALVGRQPFGGFKLSGAGSQAGGPDYLLQFIWPRVVTENTLRHGFQAPLRGDLKFEI
jgi:RHH-type proline utilization regulon transcriptional repressor/proline dehydrogenase/delta 1-pyrroline-5-carboxylate dehydrogenase